MAEIANTAAAVTASGRNGSPPCCATTSPIHCKSKLPAICSAHALSPSEERRTPIAGAAMATAQIVVTP